MRLRLCVVVATLSACASTQDVTPQIAVSPGAKSRIAVMDGLRHHGDVRRWLPRVTVEEVDVLDDDAGVPEPDDDGSASANAGDEKR